MTTHNCSVDLHSYQFWTGTESSATPLKLKGSWHMDALTVAKTEVDLEGDELQAQDGCGARRGREPLHRSKTTYRLKRAVNRGQMTPISLWS